MINQIKIKNFKAFGHEQTMPIKPITLIYGANSSGKSSILQSLLMLGQSVSTGSIQNLVTNGNLVGLGSSENISHKHNLNHDLSVSIQLSSALYDTYATTNKQLEYIFPGFTFTYAKCRKLKCVDYKLSCDDDYFIRYKVGEYNDLYFSIASINDSKVLDGDKVILRKIINECEFETNYIKRKLLKAVETNLHREILHALACTEYGLKISRVDAPLYSKLPEYFSLIMKSLPEKIMSSENFFSCLGKYRRIDFSDILPEKSPVNIFGTVLGSKQKVLPHYEENPYIGGPFIDKIELRGLPKSDSKLLCLKLNAAALEKLHTTISTLGEIKYLTPLRSLPRRYYISDETSSFEQTQDISGEKTAEVLYHQKGLIGAVNEWFVRLNIPYSIDVSLHENDGLSVYVIKITDQYGTSVTPADVGFGISQILPVIISSLSQRKEILLMEQPEIHLHPKLQTELGDLLIESAKNNNNTIIAETHSEHLLLRILRRIRETAAGTLKDTSLALTPEDVAILYVKPSDEGSQVLHLRIDDEGDFIDEWPGGFFEESFEEKFAGR